MAITKIPPQIWTAISATPGLVASVTLDATGESTGIVGVLELERGASGSKVLSAAGGGSIIWVAGGSAITFANAGTTIRLGLQDVAATGLEDGTFDVYADLVGGTDTITTSTPYQTAMESGTKTLAAGDLFAVVLEMLSRAGADTVNIRRADSTVFNGSQGFPYGTADTGALAKTSLALVAILVFDDGTVGWIRGVGYPIGLPTYTAAAINSGTTPDEYIGTWTWPVPIEVSGIAAYLTNVAAADLFELILYSDPYGTPAVIQAVSVDPNYFNGSGGILVNITPVTLTAGAVYGVAVRPTTTNNISVNYVDLGVGLNEIKKALMLPDCKVATRTNQTGAFTELQTYYAPAVGILVTGLDDGQNITVGAHQSQILAPFRAAGY